MRRTDREITSPQEISAVIQESQVCRLALSRDDQPYIVPLSFGYNGEALSFHTTVEGMKINTWTANPEVCFEFDTAVELIIGGDQPCQWSFYYQSVISTGTLRELSAEKEKIRDLNKIAAHYGECSRTFSQQQLENIRVWKLTIETISGKRSAGKDGV